MSEKNINLPVNWVDGMKINKDHFISTDKNIVHQVKNIYSFGITPFNYGLLLQLNNTGNPVNIITDVDNQGYVHVKVVKCNAVTKDGSRIEIDENYFPENDLTAALPNAQLNTEETQNKTFFIALSINSLERIPHGNLNPEENPPRLPYVLPGYNLSIHSAEDKNSITGENSLIVGKLILEENKPVLDKNYIPPCQSIYSHPGLVEYYAQLIKIFGEIELDIVEILHGINERKQSTNIAKTVADISESVLNFLGVHMVEFRRIARYKPPVVIFEQIASLARIINNAINKQSSADKEELLNYIQDWSSLKQGEFEEMLNKTVEYIYDHDDINSSVNALAPFVNVTSKLFNTLSNLEFIGKKKDRQIFVKEQKQKPGNSFLVD